MLRQKSETQHQIPGISNLPFCYFHLYTHGLTYTKGGSRTLFSSEAMRELQPPQKA